MRFEEKEILENLIQEKEKKKYYDILLKYSENIEEYLFKINPICVTQLKTLFLVDLNRIIKKEKEENEETELENTKLFPIPFVIDFNQENSIIPFELGEILGLNRQRGNFKRLIS